MTRLRVFCGRLKTPVVRPPPPGEMHIRGLDLMFSLLLVGARTTLITPIVIGTAQTYR